MAVGLNVGVGVGVPLPVGVTVGVDVLVEVGVGVRVGVLEEAGQRLSEKVMSWSVAWTRTAESKDVSEHEVEGARDLGRSESVDQQACIADLAGGAASHKAPQLVFESLPPPRWLLLQGAERVELALDVNNGLD